MTTVLVFGTFDVIHPGHLHFLGNARTHGDRLVASVARDRFVERFKGRPPLHPEGQRLAYLLKTGLVDQAHLSDEETGTYDVIERSEADVICLGHDQQALKRNLESWLERENKKIRVVTLRSYQAHRYKSSLLNNRP